MKIRFKVKGANRAPILHLVKRELYMYEKGAEKENKRCFASGKIATPKLELMSFYDHITIRYRMREYINRYIICTIGRTFHVREIVDLKSKF